MEALDRKADSCRGAQDEQPPGDLPGAWPDYSGARAVAAVPLLYFLADTYAATQAVAVRRQAEVGPRVISLGVLLHEIAGDPERLSRERYLSHYDSYARRAQGEPEWAERFAGDVGDYVDPDLVRADLEELRNGTARTKDLVDKHLAHADKDGLSNPPTFGELHSAIDAINEQFKKYVLLLTVSSYATLIPVPQYDWLAVFRQPWIK